MIRHLDLFPLVPIVLNIMVFIKSNAFSFESYIILWRIDCMNTNIQRCSIYLVTVMALIFCWCFEKQRIQSPNYKKKSNSFAVLLQYQTKNTKFASILSIINRLFNPENKCMQNASTNRHLKNDVVVGRAKIENREWTASKTYDDKVGAPSRLNLATFLAFLLVRRIHFFKYNGLLKIKMISVAWVDQFRPFYFQKKLSFSCR